MNEDFWKIQAEARAALCNDWEKLYKAMQQIKDEEIAELKKEIAEFKKQIEEKNMHFCNQCNAQISREFCEASFGTCCKCK